MNRLARLYLSGRGVGRDPVEAAALHLTAREAGLADDPLDQALERLSGEEKDRAEARAVAWRLLREAGNRPPAPVTGR